MKKLRRKIKQKIKKLIYGKTRSEQYRIGSNDSITIDGVKDTLKINGLTIICAGGNNHIEITSPCIFENATIRCLGNSKVFLNKCRLKNFHLDIHQGGTFSVDEGSSVCGEFHLVNEWGTSMYVGKDCMFSGNGSFWPTDGHQVTDKTGACVNKAKRGIVIGNHVWVGHRVMILKNVHIADNCIIGAGSVVSKSCDIKGAVMAGNPAAVVKTGVSWNRDEPK